MLLICFVVLGALLCFVVTTEDADSGAAESPKGPVGAGQKNDNR